MNKGFLQRVEILFQQSRYEEAKVLLHDYLAEHPGDLRAQYLLAASLLNAGDKKEGRKMTEQLLAQDAQSPIFLALATEVELAEEKYEAADSLAGQLLRMEPESASAHVLQARAKLGQRNYDRALTSVEMALSHDPEDVQALNLKITLSGLLGHNTTRETIDEALQISPDDPHTIANQGYQLVREGKINEALERLQYALSLNPSNQLARFAMMEALKARFWPYRMYFKYKEKMSKLSGGGLWGFIIGAYIVYNLLRRAAAEHPALWPIVYVLAGLFILTWVMDPLMNLYLLSNKYGRLLLDQDDKTMAKLCGVSLLLALIFLAGYIGTGNDQWIFNAAMFVLYMIPLGTFLNANRPKNRKITSMFTMGIVGIGVLGIALNSISWIMVSLVGLFIYQWVINGILIRENSRKFD